MQVVATVDRCVEAGQSPVVPGLCPRGKRCTDGVVESLADRPEAVGLLLDPRGEIGECRCGAGSGVPGTVEEGVEAVADRAVAVGGRGQCLFQRLRGTAQGRVQAVRGVRPTAEIGAGVVELGTGGAGDVPRALEQRGGGVQHAGEGAHGLRPGAQLDTDVLHPRLDPVDRCLGVILFEVVVQGRHHTQPDTADDLGEGVVDLGDHTLCTLLGEHRGQGVLLLVGVQVELGRLGPGGVEGQQGGTEVLR